MTPLSNTASDLKQDSPVAQFELSPLSNVRPAPTSLADPDPYVYIPDITAASEPYTSTPPQYQDLQNIDSRPRPVTSPTGDCTTSGKYPNTRSQDGRKPNAGMKSTLTSLPPAEVSSYVDMRPPVTHSYHTRPTGKSHQDKHVVRTVYANTGV